MSECLHHEDGDGDCIHHACANCYNEIYGELIPLRAAAREALTVLTRLADAGLPVPLGFVVDAAKARLAAALDEEVRR